MKKRQRKEKNSLLFQYIIGIILLTLVITSSFLYLVWLSMKPYQTAKVEGERLAKQYANLETVSQIDIFNGLESYYSVLGQDKNQKPVAVLIEKSSNNIYVYQLENGTSRDLISQTGFSAYRPKVILSISVAPFSLTTASAFSREVPFSS